MSDKTGGPAFPQPNHLINTDRGREEARGWMDDSGMTLLDWFAGQALSGLSSSWYDRHKDDLETLEGSGPREIAQAAYAHADAMLAEKARREATCKDCLQVPDHSPDAGKMAKLEGENRELAQALIRCVRLLEVIPEAYVNSETGKPLTHSPDGALANANAVIAKLKNHRREAGHE